jgi:hypothetical protein
MFCVVQVIEIMMKRHSGEGRNPEAGKHVQMLENMKTRPD